eukprot:CAMPEP_0170455784 /NCGR_PEP_ID=MMETSP0123-20130129/3628_1 /TAXON_ID=182087 /ORGANISM="Favella ehrenbergii, Strain Fehren 1" /LENGTH=57 /DNA_ID=CAMNT_0010719027 /DNA_START=1980 /DNA_END=2153 /DNA_ORIENTATION=-
MTHEIIAEEQVEESAHATKRQSMEINPVPAPPNANLAAPQAQQKTTSIASSSAPNLN